MSSGIQTIDWPSLKSGTTIQMKDLPSVKLLKLDNTTGLYYGYSESHTIVKIKEYVSESNGHYYYFQISPEDWHPLTTRLWNV
jgi:hypothetical protein